jgi:hypothetical protein
LLRAYSDGVVLPSMANTACGRILPIQIYRLFLPGASLCCACSVRASFSLVRALSPSLPHPLYLSSFPLPRPPTTHATGRECARARETDGERERERERARAQQPSPLPPGDPPPPPRHTHKYPATAPHQSLTAHSPTSESSPPLS